MAYQWMCNDIPLSTSTSTSKSYPFADPHLSDSSHSSSRTPTEIVRATLLRRWVTCVAMLIVPLGDVEGVCKSANLKVGDASRRRQSQLHTVIRLHAVVSGNMRQRQKTRRTSGDTVVSLFLQPSTALVLPELWQRVLSPRLVTRSHR